MDKANNRIAFEFFLRRLDTKRGGGVLDDKSVRQYLFDVANVSDALNMENVIDYDLYTITDPEIARTLRNGLLAMRYKLSEINLIRHHSFSAALLHFERYLREGANLVEEKMKNASFVPLQFDKERAKDALKGLADDFIHCRSKNTIEDEVTIKEQELLDLYRKLSKENKQFAFKVITILSKGQ